MQVQLVMFKSDGTRRDFTLSRGRIVIGRTNEAGLRIPLSSVSRKHCEIVIEDGVAKVRDLGSSNGTMHNSERVKEAVLAPGDQIEVGPVVFIVVIDGVPAEVEPVRSLLEQELVDTSIGLPAQDEDEAPALVDKVVDKVANKVVDKVVSKPKQPVARVMEPPPLTPSEDEVIGELDPVPAEEEIDPLEAAAAVAAKAAPAKPALKPEESYSDGATEIDLDDPIAALERLAAAEAEADAEFSMLTQQRDAKASAKKTK